MAYFQPSIDAEGIHVPSYADIMEYLLSQYKAIFGDDVYVGTDSKDYQIMSIFAKCMEDYSSLVVDAYNSRNPNYAEGDSLDLLLPLVSMTRRAATSSTATLKLTGTAGTSIAAGKSVIDSNGNLWDLSSGATLDGNGVANVMAVCRVAGAITAAIGTINQIYTPVAGWTGVTNEAPAIVGKNTETDDEVRARRKQMINLQTNGTQGAILRAINALEVDGESVNYVSVAVNDTGSTDANGIPARSICCVVDGLSGHEDMIGEAIWNAKSPGVGTYGGPSGTTRISVNYVDEFGNTNVVNFARPKTSAVTVAIAINKGTGYPVSQDDEDRLKLMIKNSIIEEIEGLGIGHAWNVTTAYRDIYNAFAGEDIPFVITSVTGIKTGMGSASSVSVPCAFNEILTVAESNITITAT